MYLFFFSFKFCFQDFETLQMVTFLRLYIQILQLEVFQIFLNNLIFDRKFYLASVLFEAFFNFFNDNYR